MREKVIKKKIKNTIKIPSLKSNIKIFEKIMNGIPE